MTFFYAFLVKGGIKVTKFYFVKVFRFLAEGEKKLNGLVNC